jgi:hypothetical protein
VRNHDQQLHRDHTKLAGHWVAAIEWATQTLTTAEALKVLSPPFGMPDLGELLPESAAPSRPVPARSSKPTSRWRSACWPRSTSSRSPGDQFHDTLPKGPSGKILKRDIDRSQFAGALAHYRATKELTIACRTNSQAISPL